MSLSEQLCVKAMQDAVDPDVAVSTLRHHIALLAARITELEAKVDWFLRAQNTRDAEDQATIDALNNEVHVLRRDAERYRVLRAQHWDSGRLCVVTHPKKNVLVGSYCPSEERLDDLCDRLLEEALP